MTSGAPPVGAPGQAAASASNETSLLPFIVELEERMTLEQLSLDFKEQTREWQGPEHMWDLYNLWLPADIQARGLVASDDLPGNSTNETREDTLSFPIPHQPKQPGLKK